MIEPRERVEQLTTLATELRGRAESLAYDGDVPGLVHLASAYKELLGDDLLGPAHALPTEQREAVLGGIRDELGRADSAFGELAAVKPGALTAGPLQEMAKAARDSQRDIQKLLKAA